MTIRQRTLIKVALAIILLVAVVYAISNKILLQGFAAVEQESTIQKVEQAADAVAAEYTYLKNKSGDWGNWDDTYNFMEDANPEYVKTNLTDQAFLDMVLNVMLFVRPSGTLVAGKAYDLENNKEIEISQALQQHLSPDDLLLQAPDGEGSRTGLVILPEGPMLIVSRPIFTSEGKGPSHGMLIMGRYLDTSLIKQLSQTTHLNLQVLRLDEAELPPDFQAARSSLSPGAPIFVRPLSEQSMAGYTVLSDIYGKPALLLRVSTPRPIYEQGQATLRYIFWALLAVGLLFGSASLVLMERTLRSWQAQKESEERFRAVTESANDAIIAADRSGRIISWNRGAKRIFGYGEEEIIDHPITILFAKQYESIHREALEHVQRSGTSNGHGNTYEVIALRKDKTEFPVEISPATWQTSRGEFYSFIIRDVTEHKKAEAALRESEAKYRTLVEETPAVAYVSSIDARGSVLYTSPQIKRLLGFSQTEWMADPQIWIKLLHPEDRERVLSEYTRIWNYGVPFRSEYRLLDRKGNIVWVHDEATAVQEETGQARLVQGLMLDISERRRAEQALQESEERYSLAVRGANDGLWDWNIKTNQFYYSPRWKSMLGYEADEISPSPDEWFERVHPDDLARVHAEISAHLQGLTPYFQSEHRMQHLDGSLLWVLSRGVAVRDEHGSPYRMAGSLSDITTRKRAEEQLLHDAFHDTLTGLPNRALFMDRLGRAVERAKRLQHNVFAVLYLDLDRFKVINDNYGHSIGDQLLIETAQRLQLCLRSADTVARLGGDEFVILLEDIQDLQDATRAVDRIQSELTLPFLLDGRQIFISTSIGVVLRGREHDRAEQVLRDADIAMYRAKALGKARYEVFDTEMGDRIRARLALEMDLRGAIERQEFRLHYQPVMSLGNNRIRGFEALVRWQHPQRGLIPPAEFIPIAEETGLILPLGQWVLAEACRQMSAWQSRFPFEPALGISVNLSTRQFAQSDLPEQIAQILEETGLNARSLGLEITESAIMEDAASGANMLTRLRALGVEVQIDDFGTGYSSLSYLQQFPISTLKIDRSFVNRMSTQGNGNGAGSEILLTIVALARQLGLKVIAEGVETADQLARLRTLECEYGQGYFISRPMAADKVEALISALDQGRTVVEGSPTVKYLAVAPGGSEIEDGAG